MQTLDLADSDCLYYDEGRGESWPDVAGRRLSSSPDRKDPLKNSISVSASGILYENPKPHLRSIVAYHPSLVVLGEDEFLATFDLAQAVEAQDYHTVVARSLDGGLSWNVEGPLLSHPLPATTHSVRVSGLADGTLVGFGSVTRRDDPDQGALNRETFGVSPKELIAVRSRDKGRTWSTPDRIDPPLVGSGWEICHHILELSDGRWLAPTATWRDWNGENPSGEQTVVFISDDCGSSWPSFGRCFDGRNTGWTHFEVSVIQLRDGRILAVSWVYDIETQATHPSEYSISEDRGESFSRPMHTGFYAQTCKVTQLVDGRLLAVYRRHDKPGLWAALARLEGNEWVNLSQTPIWEGAGSGMKGEKGGADELSGLQFGYPSFTQIPGGDVFLVFWCQEDCLTHIRWSRLRLG